MSKGVAISQQLLKEWDYEKNTVLPETKTEGSNYKAWWICPECGRSYQTRISNRVRGTRCPYCTGKKVIPGVNDLATLHPELLDEWDYEKNNVLPSEIFAGSQKPVWWKCKECGYSWQTELKNRTRKSHGCPRCYGNNHKQVAQYTLEGELVKIYPSARAAAKAIPVDVSSISLACNGKIKNCCDSIWKFLDDDNKQGKEVR